MKLLAGVLITLLLILGGGYWLNLALQKSSDQLVVQIDQITSSVEADNWNEAKQQANNFEISWKQEARWWPVFLEHQEMDNIEFSMAKLKEYVANQDDSLSLGQLSEIKTMIEHIPRKEDVNLQNVM